MELTSIDVKNYWQGIETQSINSKQSTCYIVFNASKALDFVKEAAFFIRCYIR